MKRIAGILALAVCAAAQSTPDPAKVEKFLRRYFGLPETVKLQVGAFTPSEVKGLFETKVKVSHEGGQQEATYYVTTDGTYLLQAPAIALTGDPFAATRAKMDLKDSPSLGSPLAPVTVVEYSDFQCGFCRSAAAILRGPMIKNFPSEVRLVYKDFPLTSIHAWAVPSAALGRCIHKRYGEAFWDYHDWVFATQPELTPQNFKEKALGFAKQRGMDTAHLGACMDKPEVRAEVDRSMAEGESVGVSGTPTLFINGRKKVGVRSLEDIREAIQLELAYVKEK